MSDDRIQRIAEAIAPLRVEPGRRSVPPPNPRPAPRTTDQLHDVDSAAEYLRCGRRLIYRLVAERQIRHTKAGRSLRFWQSDLDAYLNARAVEPTGASGPRP
jgi:excisionase family DNA binding protein